MKISTRRNDYTEIEQEICGIHLAEEDPEIDHEFEQLKKSFAGLYANLKPNEDYEFTDWHDNIRMLWVYLYSDSFYNIELLVNSRKIIESMESKWFVQFECYSKELESERNQTGAIGWFLVFKDSVIFDGNREWDRFLKRIVGFPGTRN